MRTLLVLLSAIQLAAPAPAQLFWRVSIKQILSPTGMLPTNGCWRSQTDAQLAVAEANRYLDLTGRGYQLLLTDYVTVPDTNNFWMLPPSPQNVLLIENYARSNAYGFRADAINVYVSQSSGGTFVGYCSFPGDGYSTVLLANTCSRSRGQLLLHEIGHFFDLGHTFHNSTCCDQGANPGCSHAFGSTGIPADLIPDLSCNFPDEISTNAFGRPVAALPPAERVRFGLTYSNLMSYHPQTILLSDLQNDIMAITANSARANATVGRTWFVSNSGFVFGAGSRTSQSLPTVGWGIFFAPDGDVVLIHAGTYNEPGPYTKAVTLCATRGSVRIGSL